jgi:hypothetical protein
MSSIVRTGDQDQRQLAYIATAAFNTAIFSYTVTFNGTTLQNVGVLATLPTATTVNCPRGRVLRANGKRLYPGANPGVTQFMVGVFDAQSQLSGFIDPNNSIFSVFNADKPVWVPDTVNFPADGLGLQRGQPVFTSGDVISAKQIIGGVNALTSITANGAAAAQTIDPSLGQTFTLACSPPSGTATITINASTPAVGAYVRLAVTNTTGFQTTIDFTGTGFSASTANLLTGSTANRLFIIEFISHDGVRLYEVSRTTALVLA